MKLSYRGISYEYTPAPVEVTEGELAGKYRGLDWRFCKTDKKMVQQPTLDLMYRGVAHTTGLPQTPVLSAPEKARSRMLESQRKIQNRQRSILTRLAAEVGLVRVVAES